jgi:hypothetical protein
VDLFIDGFLESMAAWTTSEFAMFPYVEILPKILLF